MDKNLMIILTVAAGIAVVALSYTVAVIARKKHLDITGFAKAATDVYGTAETLSAVLKPFLPEPYSGWLTILFSLADKAVRTVEDAWQAGNCPDEQRREKATQLIENGFVLENIAVDEKVKKLIDVAVELMVQTLPKSHREETA